MAGMPQAVVMRAGEIMHHLEQDKIQGQSQGQERLRDVPKANYQLNIFDARDPKLEQVKALLDKVDFITISPVEALLKLTEMQMVLRKQ